MLGSRNLQSVKTSDFISAIGTIFKYPQKFNMKVICALTNGAAISLLLRVESINIGF